MGVLRAAGLHGMGQRSRHSGWVTALQSWQRRYSLPNFVLFPHDTQNSDLITLVIEGTQFNETAWQNKYKYLF